MANKVSMLQEMPDMLSSLRTMPGAPLVSHVISVAVDEAALQLCRQLHQPALCLLDDWQSSNITCPILSGLSYHTMQRCWYMME